MIDNVRGGRVKRPLRWLGVLGMGLAAGAPSPGLAQGQALTRDQLIGSWLQVTSKPRVDHREKQVVREILLTLNADSSWTLQVRDDGVMAPLDSQPFIWKLMQTRMPEHRWYFLGDSLWLGNPDKYATSRPEYRPRKIQLRGQQLLMADYGTFHQTTQPHAAEIYECFAKRFTKVEGSKFPPPVKAEARGSAVKPADLVGTWIVQRPDSASVIYGSIAGMGKTDTLTLKADSTWRQVSPWERYGPQVAGGTWFLLPGDSLWFAAKRPDGVLQDRGAGKITLGSRQFSYSRSCTEPAWIYKRVGP